METKLAELPQTQEAAAKLQAQIDEREEALKKLGEEYTRTREELRAASIQRDPEFIEKFEKGRQFQVEQLRTLAGASEAEVSRALKDRNYERLIEVREQLPPHQQYRWDAILRKIEEIDLEREQAVQDSDKTWERILENRRQEAVKHHAGLVDSHRAIAAQIINRMREKVDFFREDKELQQQVAAIAEGIAGGKGAEQWTPETIMGTAVALPVLQKVNAMQAKAIEENKVTLDENAKQLAELQKKLEERDEFIKTRYGSLDFTAPAAKASNGDYDPERPIHEQIAVRRS